MPFEDDVDDDDNSTRSPFLCRHVLRRTARLRSAPRMIYSYDLDPAQLFAQPPSSAARACQAWDGFFGWPASCCDARLCFPWREQTSHVRTIGWVGRVCIVFVRRHNHSRHRHSNRHRSHPGKSRLGMVIHREGCVCVCRLIAL